jgi:DNA-binding LacI/PurR family transcriptional regulator
MVSGPDVIRIAADATVSPSTVKRVLAGGGNENSRRRVRDVCRKLELTEALRALEQQEAAHAG